MINDTVDIKQYFLPENADETLQALVDYLNAPEPFLGMVYQFSHPVVIQAMRDADAKGIANHLILDEVQEAGSEKEVVLALAKDLKYGSLTISTAGINSTKPSNISHDKIFVKKGAEGWQSTVWQGSLNISVSAFSQTNTVVEFNSDKVANEFARLWQEHHDWAWQHLANKQIMEKRDVTW